AARTRGRPRRKTPLVGRTKQGGGRRKRERERIRSRRREEAKAPQRPPPPSPNLRAHPVRPPWRNTVPSQIREFWSIAETGWDVVRTFPFDGARESFDRRTQSILRRTFMASPYGALGRFPPGVLRRLRGDPRDRLGPVLRPTPRTAVPLAHLGLLHLPGPRDLVDHRDCHPGRLLRWQRMARAESRSARGPLPRSAAVMRCPKASNSRAGAGSTTS